MSAYVRNPDTLSRDLLDGVILLPPGHDDPVRLNLTGAEVWDLLAVAHEPTALVDVLADRYRREPAEVATAVLPLIDELVALRAVLVSTPAVTP